MKCDLSWRKTEIKWTENHVKWCLHSKLWTFSSLYKILKLVKGESLTLQAHISKIQKAKGEIWSSIYSLLHGRLSNK